MDLTALLANARQIAEAARFNADNYAQFGTKAGKVAGAGYRRGGVDQAHLSALVAKAEDAERAVRDLEDLIKIL